MVIYYNLETKEMDRTEENTLEPILPYNMSVSDKIEFYRKQGIGFLVIPQELGAYVWDYELSLDEEENVIGIKPKKRD